MPKIYGHVKEIDTTQVPLVWSSHMSVLSGARSHSTNYELLNIFVCSGKVGKYI